MKSLLKLMSRVLVAVFLLLFIFWESKAQSKIQFRGLLIKLEEPKQASKLKQPKRAPTMANRRFWILQLSEPQKESNLKSLVSRGVVIGQAIGNACFLANFPTSLDLVELENYGISGLALYPKEASISKSLDVTLRTGPRSSKIDITLVPHTGFTESFIRKNWDSSWGEISEVWQGPVQKWSISGSHSQILELANQDWIQWMEEAEGEIVPFNQKTAANARTTYISSGLNGLDGSGVTVAIGDGGLVELHADLESHQQNLTGNKIGSFGDHQDHVSGTVAGLGLLQSDKKGIAPGTKLLNLQSSSVVSTGPSLRQNFGVTITNNSYGINLNCSRAGSYSATSSFIDAQMNSQTDLLHVFAAGNQGGSGCSPYPAGFRTISEGYQVSKNVLTVGSIADQDQFAWFSSRGPAQDGRVKPEIVSNGNEVLSTVPFDSYGEKGGTSMATPVLTGVLSLLTQQYKLLNNQQIPEAALLKALVCNTAEDLGSPNVDFSNGYGRVNARRAREAIQNQTFKSGSIGSNGLNQFNLTAPANAKGIKVMLSWSDPAAAAATNKALINDLDLNVANGSGITFQPWVLNPTPSQVADAAIRGIDTLNNLEQTTLQVAGNENITIKVNAKAISGINQKYWIVYEWQLPSLVLTSPVAGFFGQGGQAVDFVWDMTELAPSSLILESSLDSISGYVQAAVVSNPLLRFQTFIFPNQNIEKRFYRLTASGAFGSVTSNVVGISISNRPILVTQTCNQTAFLNWNAIPGASRYEVLKLDLALGKWISNAFVSGTSFIANQLENGSRQGFAVKPWFGNIAGLQSDGKIIIPNSGACPLAMDLGISDIIKPSSVRLNTPSASQQNPAKVVVQNFGNQDVVSQTVSLHYRLNSGQEFQSTQVISIPSGQRDTLQLSQLLVPNTADTFALKVWIEWLADQNEGNNGLTESFVQLNNPAIVLPWSFDVENIDNQSTTKNTFSFSKADFLQFNTTEKSRMRTNSSNSIPGFGSKSLILDKAILDGKNGSSELIITLNLENYAQTDLLILDFDWMAFGGISTGNSLWVRSSESASWQEVKRFWQEVYSSNQPISFTGINLYNYLNNIELSSSFQIKFTFSGQKPSDIPLGSGYAIDNLLLSIPKKEIVAKKFLGPTGGCSDNSVVRKVKVRLFNTSESTIPNVSVGYKVSDKDPVENTIASIPANDSLDYEFDDTLSTDLVGKLKFKVWVRAQDDNYPTNDTLRNLMVFISPKITQYPYYQGFEENDGDWKAYGTRSSWEWGLPARNLSVIDTAANGTKIWVTNFSGNYNGNELSYLESPCFDLRGLSDAFQFSFNSIFQMEQDYDFAWLEISEDGLVWTKVGEKGKGTNWYNHDSQQWNGLRKNWSVNSFTILDSTISDKRNVRFRFAFDSDISLSYEGIGIDDIHIESGISILADSTFHQLKPKDENGEWVQFGQGINLVAEVERREEMGGIELQMKKNETGLRYSEYTPYLDRNFFISPDVQPISPVKVRLFIKDEELKKLQAADPNLISFQQLGIYKYDGPNEDLILENNSALLGQHEFIKPGLIIKVPTAGGYFLEFEVASFSEFYIASRSLNGSEDPLPVKLISFLAKNSGIKGDVELEWKTASESNCEKYELSYSCDGKQFSKIQDFEPKGSENQGFDYTYLHKPGACNSTTLIYKLSQYEIGERKPALEMRATCANLNAIPAEMRLVNPATEKLQISGLYPDSKIEVYDVMGRRMANYFSKSSDFEENIHSFPAGNYFVKVLTLTENTSFRLLKQ